MYMGVTLLCSGLGTEGKYTDSFRSTGSFDFKKLYKKVKFSYSLFFW
jgi:hypothetical protein